MLLRPFDATIQELCEEILSETDPQALPKRIIQHVERTFPVDWATLWVTEHKESTGAKRLRLAAATALAEPLMTAEGGQPAVYDFDEGLTGYIAGQQVIVNITNWSDFEKHRHAKKYDNVMYPGRNAAESCRCVLGVPLLLKSTGEAAAAPAGGWRVIGVLKLENIRPSEGHPARHFTEADVSVVKAYGAVIAVALEKAQMHADSIRIGQGLLEISQSLLASLGAAPNLENIVRQTATVISAEACSIWRRRGLNLFLEAAWGYPGVTDGAPYHLDTPPGEDDERFRGVGLTVYVGSTHKPLNLKTDAEVRNHPAWRGANDGTMWSKPHGQACYSLVAIPLVDDETKDLKGVFKIENKKPTIFQLESYFSLADQHLLETLGNSICLSLIVAERFERLARLERLVGDIRVLEGLNRALFFILTGLTHGDGLQYNRALMFLKETPGSNSLVCRYAIGHMDPARWNCDMRDRPSPDRLDWDAVLETLGEDSEVYRRDIWRHWCDTTRRIDLEDVQHQKIASHVRQTLGARKYISDSLDPADVLCGFPHGDFVLVPIVIERELRGVIYADNRFTGNRINEFECRVLELFAGMAGAVLQASAIPGKLKGALQQSAGMVAHKLRNRLSISSDYLADLRERGLGIPDAANHVGVALDGVRNAQKAVTQFLGFARAEPFARRDSLLPDQLVSILKAEVERSSQVPVDVFIGTAGPRVQVDLERLRDDFVAFASDSKRHRPDGVKVVITAEAPTDEEVRRFKLPASSKYLKLTYSDNGPGIPRDQKSRIFEPFYSTTGGAGLGLAVAAHNAKVHGGCIIETGEEGQGVRFEIFLSGGA